MFVINAGTYSSNNDLRHSFTRFIDGCAVEGVHFLNKNGREGASVMLVEGNNFTLTNCLIENFYQGIMLGRMVDPSTPFAFYSNIQITNNKILNVSTQFLVPKGWTQVENRSFIVQDIWIHGRFNSPW